MVCITPPSPHPSSIRELHAGFQNTTADMVEKSLLGPVTGSSDPQRQRKISSSTACLRLDDLMGVCAILHFRYTINALREKEHMLGRLNPIKECVQYTSRVVIAPSLLLFRVVG